MSLTPANFPIISEALAERRLQQFAVSLQNIEAYETEGVLLKVEFSDLSQSLSSRFDEAWSAVILEPHVYRRGDEFRLIPDRERKVIDAAYSRPTPYLAAGQLRKVEALKTGLFVELRADMIAFLKEAVMIADRVQALKDKIGKRAPKATKTSMARDERAAKAKTCQCCGADILAETGVIAHHGYQRPAGMGYQTASCEGARELAFEVSRDALGAQIVRMKDYVVRVKGIRADVMAEEVSIPWTYGDRSAQRQRWEPVPSITVRVTRENFAEAVETAAPKRMIKPLDTVVTFDSLKARYIAELDGDINATEGYIRRQEKRFATWVKKLDWNGTEYVPYVEVTAEEITLPVEDDFHY